MRFLLRVTFEMAGHSVEEAPNGLAAVQPIEGGRVPDLVATDFMMPLMNGGELIARLRRNPATERDPDHPGQLEPRLGAADRRPTRSSASRSIPSALTACVAQAAREGRVMERLSAGDAGLDLVLGGGLPAGCADRRRRAAGQRQDDSRPADLLRERDAGAQGALLHDLVGAAREDGAAPRAVRVLRRRRTRRSRRVHPSGGADRRRRRRTGSSAAADEILRQSFETKPAIIVIDSSKALHDVVEPDEFRRAIYDLASKVAYSERRAHPRRRVLRRRDPLAAGVRGRRRDRPTRERSARARSTGAGCAS